MTFLRAVLDEADELGLAWWEHLALILAAALLTVAGRRAFEKVKAIEWKVEPAPPPVSDGGALEDERARAAPDRWERGNPKPPPDFGG